MTRPETIPNHRLRETTITFCAIGAFLIAAILAAGTGVDLIGWSLP